MLGIESFEKDAFKTIEINIKEKMSLLNKSFKSALSPENGIYGVVETVKGEITEQLGKNELGHTVKTYVDSLSGQVTKIRESLGGHNVKTTYFDDNGTAYLQKVTKLDKNLAKEVSATLTPDITIKKGNFTAEIDSFSRPVRNKITDLQLKSASESRESLYNIVKDDSYGPNDHIGHLIADNLSGPASQENVVAQLDKVNQGKIARVEETIRKLKSEGHTVDYEVKTNYVGTDKRPSSFEPKITVDGKEYTDLPDDLKKIYNSETNTTISHVSTTLGEKFGLAHELGVKSGLVAAGLTCAVSTVDNVSSFIDGEISAEDMAMDIAKDTATAGGVAYGSTFVTTAVAQAMSKSSVALISKVGGSCLPGAVVSFAVESYTDVSDFAQGEIDSAELAYNLGENASGIAGGLAGGAATGALLGTVAGPVGTIAGTLVGGVVGCALSTEAYKSAVELGAEGAGILAEKAQQFAGVTIDAVSEAVPEKVADVKSAFSDFFSSVDLPFSI